MFTSTDRTFPPAANQHQGVLMYTMSPGFRAKLPFLIAGFMAFLFSVTLYFVLGERTIGIFVGLWVPSIHSLGTLVLTPVDDDVTASMEQEVRS